MYDPHPCRIAYTIMSKRCTTYVVHSHISLVQNFLTYPDIDDVVPLRNALVQQLKAIINTIHDVT